MAERCTRDCRPQAGLTLIETMVVLAIIALVMAALVGPQVMAGWQRARKQTAWMLVRGYAEAHVRWSFDHEEPCPASIEELSSYASKKDPRDPWGSRLIPRCGDGTLPAGEVFGVVSPGPDRQEGTADDIRSWDERPPQ